MMKTFLGRLNAARLTQNFVALVFVVGINSSCKNDEVPNPLLGTWKYISDSYTGCDDGSPDFVQDYLCNASDCQKITFTSDGKLSNESIINGITTTKSGTYTTENTQLIICTVGCDEPVAFEVSGNTLSLIREDDAGCTVVTRLERIN